MNVQIFNKPFAESFWLQTAVLVVLTAVLLWRRDTSGNAISYPECRLMTICAKRIYKLPKSSTSSLVKVKFMRG
jgi:hypothetical protein